MIFHNWRVVDDQKPKSSVKQGGFRLFYFKIVDVFLLINTLTASGKFLETAGKKHGRDDTFLRL
jgi:hypothetical protein